jgi:glutaredoxin 3
MASRLPDDVFGVWRRCFRAYIPARMSDSRWTLFIKPRCPWCLEAIDFLKQHGYGFEQVDVTRDRAAYDRMQKLSGQRLTPTLFIEESKLLLADFDTGQLQKFLALHKLAAG